MPVAEDKCWWPMREARNLHDRGYLSGSGQWERLGSGRERRTKGKGPLLEGGWGGSHRGGPWPWGRAVLIRETAGLTALLGGEGPEGLWLHFLEQG